MHVLVLGGYGFIGLEAARLLIARGHRVTALGRALAFGQRVLPGAAWKNADIATLGAPEQWAPLLVGVDAVVNASGALQDGARDNLAAAQKEAVRALVTACENAGVRRFVQISAPGASAGATTNFLRTKAAGDDAVKASALSWTILRPGLVWGRTASGGTALVRMLSAFPLVQPLILADARVQMAGIDDVCEAIVRGVEGGLPARSDIDIVEDTPLTLGDVVAKVRAWHGFAPAPTLRVPNWIGALMARAADAAGWLGWRSPLRSTSLRALERGVVGDPRTWLMLTGAPLASFEQQLSQRPATRQDRLFAGTQLVLPLIVICLAAFWIASGCIGLARVNEAARVLDGGVANPSALVLTGAYADIALGAALLWRPWARMACLGMIALTCLYLAAGTILTPHLWADPLGPFLKTLPATVLALVCALLLEER